MNTAARDLANAVSAVAQTVDTKTAERVRDESLARLERGEDAVHVGAVAYFEMLLIGARQNPRPSVVKPATD
jgi:hypothetical protein